MKKKWRRISVKVWSMKEEWKQKANVWGRGKSQRKKNKCRAKSRLASNVRMQPTPFIQTRCCYQKIYVEEVAKVTMRWLSQGQGPSSIIPFPSNLKHRLYQHNLPSQTFYLFNIISLMSLKRKKNRAQKAIAE